MAQVAYLYGGCGTGWSLTSVDDRTSSETSYTNIFYPSQGSIFCTEKDRKNDHNYPEDRLQWSEILFQVHQTEVRRPVLMLDRQTMSARVPTTQCCPDGLDLMITAALEKTSWLPALLESALHSPINQNHYGKENDLVLSIFSSPTLEEHIKHLNEVLELLEECYTISS